jgi:MFS family permease
MPQRIVPWVFGFASGALIAGAIADHLFTPGWVETAVCLVFGIILGIGALPEISEIVEMERTSSLKPMRDA